MKHRRAGATVLALLIASAAAGPAAAQSLCSAGETSRLFNFTGSTQTYTVPGNVNSVKFYLRGGQGGTGATGGNNSSGGAGGLGGHVAGSRAVTAGETYTILVGGQGGTPTGGFNGGANGGSQNAGGGGGASDVRFGGTAEANRIATAGGGGGGGRAGCELAVVAGGGGGAGGGGNGSNGTDAQTPNQSPTGVAGGGQGAVGSAAGAAGIGCSGFLGTPGASAGGGTGGTGGSGQSCCCFNALSIPGGGGGGGGFVGGGGGGGGSAGTTACSGNDKGAGGGGAGGTSDASGLTSTTVTPGVNVGNGFVEVCEAAVTPGVCGTANGVATTTIPSANLCSAGNATAVTTAAGTYDWSCNGVNGGANASCSAPRQFTVTASVSGANGTAVGGGTVNYNATGTVTIMPSAGYVTVTPVGGTCGGSLVGTTYTTNPVTADCTVVASFAQIVNGTCGTSNGVGVHDAPAANLCAAGSASVVATAASQFTWTCNGANTGTNASCAAPRTYLVTASVNGSNGTATAAAGGVVNYNASGTVTITPNAGYTTVTPVAGSCGGTLAGTTYTTNLVTADCTVIASFIQPPILPTVLASPINGGTVSCVGPSVLGGTATCTAIANAGYRLTAISGCGGTAGSAPTYVTGPITAACTVTALFSTTSVPTLDATALVSMALLTLIAGGLVLRQRKRKGNVAAL